MACEAVPKKIGIQWLAIWNSNLELQLNNYQSSGIWYQKTVEKNQTSFAADCNLIPENIIVLEPAEALKFSYIVGWIIYKLTKNDHVTKSHSQFKAICTHLKILSSEQIVYEQDVRTQTTNVIPGQKFLKFIYEMESLILLLFEKHEEFGPNILQYIHNSLSNNLPLLQSFNSLFDFAGQQLLTCEIAITERQELKDDVRVFLYERIISIYMKSRQKSWRRFNDLIPEKGSSSLRENLKALRNDTQNLSRNENTFISIKKVNIPQDPLLDLAQLRIWAQLDNAEEIFSKMLQVTELQWLLWAFGDNNNTRIKRKKLLIPLIFDHLKKETQFCEEVILKGQMFTT